MVRLTPIPYRKSANALIFLNLAVVDVLLALIVMPYSVMVLLTRSHKEPIGNKELRLEAP